MSKVEKLLAVDQGQVLDKDANLQELDPRTLGKMCPTKQKAWTAEVETSQQAQSKKAQKGNKQEGVTEETNNED